MNVWDLGAFWDKTTTTYCGMADLIRVCQTKQEAAPEGEVCSAPQQAQEQKGEETKHHKQDFSLLLF